jgi:hypothetical protein
MTSDLDTGQATLVTALVAMELALADDAVVDGFAKSFPPADLASKGWAHIRYCAAGCHRSLHAPRTCPAAWD